MSLFYQKSNKIRKKENKECKNNHQATASGGAVYGLGFIVLLFILFQYPPVFGREFSVF
jgi:hypothetical protein